MEDDKPFRIQIVDHKGCKLFQCSRNKIHLTITSSFLETQVTVDSVIYLLSHGENDIELRESPNIEMNIWKCCSDNHA